MIRKDGRIDTETYDRKYKEICTERERVLKTIKNHDTAEKEYYDLGIKLVELSQKAGKMYRVGDDLMKRALLTMVFSKLVLTTDEGRLSVTYKAPFDFIARQAQKMKNGSSVPENSKKSFETLEPAVYRREDTLSTPHFGEILPGLDSNQETSPPEGDVLPITPPGNLTDKRRSRVREFFCSCVRCLEHRDISRTPLFYLTGFYFFLLLFGLLAGFLLF